MDNEENDCYEQLNRCGPDEEKLEEIFENIIKLFDDSKGSLEKTVSIDEFVLVRIEGNVLWHDKIDYGYKIYKLMLNILIS